jgi:hypothetical protein
LYNDFDLGLAGPCAEKHGIDDDRFDGKMTETSETIVSNMNYGGASLIKKSH